VNNINNLTSAYVYCSANPRADKYVCMLGKVGKIGQSIYSRTIKNACVLISVKRSTISFLPSRTQIKGM